MSIRTETVTANALREWALPAPGGSKYSRGQVVVVGGALRSPGAAMLAGIAALRLGAGRLTLAIGRSVAGQVAVAVPECGVVPLDETPDGHIDGQSLCAAGDDVSAADALLVGPGLDDADEADRLVRGIPGLVGEETVVVLDAYALGVLPRLGTALDRLRGRLVLTPNREEAERLLDGETGESLEDDLVAIARRWGAVVSCHNSVADESGRVWVIGTGTPGLGTSGSGDVLAGAVAGLCARGATPQQAAVWATHVHATAGDRLAVPVGPLGYLATELLDELPRVLVEIGA